MTDAETVDRSVFYRVTEENYECTNTCAFCVIPFLICGLIVLCTTVPLSFQYVPYDNYALLQDVYGSVKLDKVYGEGRYFFTLNYKMVKFMSTYTPVYIEASVFSSTGVQFNVDFSFFWRLPKQNVPSVYNKFSMSYPGLVLSNARTTIKDTAATLSIDLYFNNRSYVQSLFASKVAEVLANVLQVEAPPSLFVIGDVQLPALVLNASLNTAISLQRNDILTREQAVTVFSAETNRLVSAIDAQTNAILSFAVTDAQKLVQNANSYANQLQIKARGDGITGMLAKLGLKTNASTAMRIVKQLALLDNSLNTTVLSVTGESFVFKV